MPHQCTGCDTVYPNGTEEILSGCPECGWNRFRYILEEDGSDKEAAEPAGDGGGIIGELERVHESGAEALTLRDGDIESVRVLDEGSYEINVASLLEKEEIILSIGEAGRYVVHLPSAFREKADG
ncbi:MAG: hypothetical protein MAG715_00372 [Methanonatronarchaeales archaeon]|nr:hypothetical protein [Methanonatronarchaeales archaeon]